MSMPTGKENALIVTMYHGAMFDERPGYDLKFVTC
jgi:hypothetical protein